MKRLAQNVLLVGVSALLTLIAVEWFLRTFYPQSLYAVQYCYLGWCHVPAANFLHAGEQREFVTRVRYNSRGLRDYEYSYAKPPGVQRVLVFGDSYAEGLEVKMEETFAKRLERLLNERLSPNKFEVINFGVSAYDTAQEWWYFKTEGMKYHPDLVILVYTGEIGSPFITLVHGQPIFLEPQFTRSELEARRLVTFVKSRSHVASFLTDRLRLNRSVADFIHRLHERPIENGRNRRASDQTGLEGEAVDGRGALTSPSLSYEDWNAEIAILADMDETVHRRGAKLLVATIETEMLMSLARELGRSGLELLLTDLQQVSDSEERRYHYPLDGHYNPEGHAKAAGILFDTISKLRLFGRMTEEG